MGQALYRKYRSKRFNDVVGQNHITQTLSNAIKNNRISHAYLFTGPRGVGKTSVARILAHEVNGLDYTNESIHLDIIEIDAASNRRIDEIRELRDKVNITPSSAKYKVYIIDEVHMLTREAFNALLKTLEEPPAHCIFILATTEAHKLPETIVSRTQRFEFKAIPVVDAASHLSVIAKKEKITIDKPALDLLAIHGNGSFRDSISLLDQISSAYPAITEDQVRQFLGLPATQVIDSIFQAIAAGNLSEVVTATDDLVSQGADTTMVAQQLSTKLRQQLITGNAEPWVATLLKQLLQVATVAKADDFLEIVLLEACLSNASTSPPRSVVKAEPAPTVVKIPTKTVTTKHQQPSSDIKQSGTMDIAAQTSPITESNWEQIVDKVKDQAASLYTALRLATPEFSDGKLTLSFQFPLHQKKVEQAENKRLIGQIVAEVTGQDVPVKSVVNKHKKTEAETAAPKSLNVSPSGAELKNISNIFGSGEVLESTQ